MNKTIITLTALCLGLVSLQAAAIKKGDAARGAERSQTCVACHGPTGDSPTPAFPRIAGQHADYMVKVLKDYKSGARQNAIMAGIVADLSERDMQDLAAFFAQQQGGLYQVTKR